MYHFSITRKILLTFVFVLWTLPQFSFASGENIAAFSVHIKLEPNGSAIVQEEIYYDFGDPATEHHGIYRRIPLAYRLPDERKDREIELSSVMVTDGEGNMLPTKYTTGGNYAELKVGDPDVIVTGQKRYVIRYTVWGAIDQNMSDKDEFYWNATGNEWNVPILSSRADVVLPMPLQELKVTSACYRGSQGSKDRCMASTTPQEGTGIINAVRFTNDQTLQPMQGMTVAVGIPKDIYRITPKSSVKKLADSVILYHWWRSPFLNFGAVIPLVVFFVMFRLWWLKGRDPKGRGTIVAEYDIPDHLGPMEMAYLHDTSLQPAAISAAIVELAIRGYINIERTTKKVLFIETEDFQIKINTEQPPVTDLTQAEVILLDELTRHGSSFAVSSLSHKLTQVSAALTKQVAADLTARGYFEENPQVAVKNYLLTGIGLIFLGSFLPFGNFPLVASGLIITVFGFFMPRRTQRGAFVHDDIDGFKQYLSVAEGDRIKFADAPENAPAMTPATFERFLPYAMVFGVEKAWANKFADLYTNNDSAHWYHGGNGTFNAVALASGMSSFSATTATAFTSSGGGSGGGGSSGGGGGGGGGGSW